MPTTRTDVENLRDANLQDNTTGDILASELRDVITIILDYIDTEIPLINTVLNSTVDPNDGTDGIDGDFFINTTSNYIFGPKAGGTWPAGVSLIGPQGDSAYQVWLDEGNVGTQADFLASLVGATGAAGATGATGAAGADGVGFLDLPNSSTSDQLISGLTDGVHSRPFYQYHQISSISGATAIAHSMGGTALFVKHIVAHVQTAPGQFKSVTNFSINGSNFQWTNPMTGELHIHIIYSR